MNSRNKKNWSLICARCGRCCGPVPFDKKWFNSNLNKLQETSFEAIPGTIQLIDSRTIIETETITPVTTSFNCVFLTPEKRCAVYEERPALCRLFGTIPELTCPYVK